MPTFRINPNQESDSGQSDVTAQATSTTADRWRINYLQLSVWSDLIYIDLSLITCTSDGMRLSLSF